jgi:hypothetical protein
MGPPPQPNQRMFSATDYVYNIYTLTARWQHPMSCAPRWCDTPSCMRCPLGCRRGASKKILYGGAMYRRRPLESWMRMWCRAPMSLADSPRVFIWLEDGPWWYGMHKLVQLIIKLRGLKTITHEWMIRLNEIHKDVYSILLGADDQLECWWIFESLPPCGRKILQHLIDGLMRMHMVAHRTASLRSQGVHDIFAA